MRMNVSFAKPLLEELQASVPPRQRSRFISEAVREKLERERQIHAVALSAGTWGDREQDPVSAIRRQRESWRGRVGRHAEDG